MSKWYFVLLVGLAGNEWIVVELYAGPVQRTHYGQVMWTVVLGMCGMALPQVPILKPS